MAAKQGSRKEPVFVRELDKAARRHVFVVAVLRLAVFVHYFSLLLLRHSGKRVQ